MIIVIINDQHGNHHVIIITMIITGPVWALSTDQAPDALFDHEYDHDYYDYHYHHYLCQECGCSQLIENKMHFFVNNCIKSSFIIITANGHLLFSADKGPCAFLLSTAIVIIKHDRHNYQHHLCQESQRSQLIENQVDFFVNNCIKSYFIIIT